MTGNNKAALGPKGVAVAEALGLVWRCATCGASEPVEPTGGADDAYEVGDKEPCTTCETGTARVEAGLPGDQCAFDHEPETYGEWLTAVDRWSWTTDGRAPPLCPLDALYAAAAGPCAFSLDEAATFALVAELRRTRDERDAAKEDASRAAAWLAHVRELAAAQPELARWGVSWPDGAMLMQRMSDGTWTEWQTATDVLGCVTEQRDAARQELAAARAAIGEAWFLRPDDSVALALARKTTALERLADGGER